MCLQEQSRRMLLVQGLVLEKKAEVDQLVDEIEAFHKDFSKQQEEEQQRQLKIRKTESEVQVSAVLQYYLHIPGK